MTKSFGISAPKLSENNFTLIFSGLLSYTQGLGCRRTLCYFIISSKNLPHVIALALNIMKLLRLFVCLGHFSNFLISFGAAKPARLEFAMDVSINICTIIWVDTIMIESCLIRQILVFFSSLFLYNFFAQKHQF